MDLIKIAMPLAIIILGHVIQVKTIIPAIILRITGFVLLGSNIPLTSLFNDMLLIVLISMGIITTTYTVYYSKLKYRNLGLIPLIDFFTISMFFVFISEYLIEFITFWLLTELLGFFLIAYDYIAKDNKYALSAATKYLIISMIPTDIALFILLALTGFESSFEIPLGKISPQLIDPLTLTMVLLGFFSKVAIFPLHFWLPDAHSLAPAPASSLLSGLMVKMGIYALYLISFYPINKDIAIYLMLFSGFVTLIYGAMQASMQQDIKKLLAYSTTSNTALMVVTLALYIMSSDKLFLEAVVLYMVAHSIYKAFMFLDAGFIELLVHERNIRRLGYISRISPLETIALLISILSMFGMPPLIGFLAKVFLFTAISKYLTSSLVYIVALVFVSLKISLSIVYNITYLRAHIGSRIPSDKIVNRDALKLQPITFATSLLTIFVVIPLLLLVDYMGYVELGLVEKLSIQLAISAIAFVAMCMLIYNIEAMKVKRNLSNEN